MRPRRQFNTSIGQRHGDGDFNFNSAEIELQKRFSAGMLFDVNYAYSRLFRLQFEASNPVAAPRWSYDYGPVPAQPAHVFHWNYVYELPIGKGHRFGGNMSSVADAFLGGWTLSGLGTWQSGSALTITTSSGQSPTGATTNRADLVGDWKRDHSGLSRGDQALQWFNTAAFKQPPLIDANAPRPTRQFGTSGAGRVIGPSFFSYDATLQKSFMIGETYKLQFRAEVFNPFNIPMLDNPDTNVVSANFGRIRTSNPNYTPRSIQLGLRLDF